MAPLPHPFSPSPSFPPSHLPRSSNSVSREANLVEIVACVAVVLHFLLALFNKCLEEVRLREARLQAASQSRSGQGTRDPDSLEAVLDRLNTTLAAQASGNREGPDNGEASQHANPTNAGG